MRLNKILIIRWMHISSRALVDHFEEYEFESEEQSQLGPHNQPEYHIDLWGFQFL